jgi:hypothetical protein
MSTDGSQDWSAAAISDSKGNTYNAIPGYRSGVQPDLIAWWTIITNALTTSDTLTLTCAGRSFVVSLLGYQFAPAGYSAVAMPNTNKTRGTGTQAVSTSATVGDLMIGFGGTQRSGGDGGGAALWGTGWTDCGTVGNGQSALDIFFFNDTATTETYTCAASGAWNDAAIISDFFGTPVPGTGFRRRTNNALGTLGASLTNSGTTITFASAPGLPSLGAGEYTPLVLEPPSASAPSANFEVVYLTAYSSPATTGTISRGQEGTTAVAHANGAAWVCGPTNVDFPTSLGPQTTMLGLTTGTETAKSIIAPGHASLLYAVTVDQPCRVRLYATAAQATADIARLQTVDPTGNHGCLLELVFTAAGTFNLAPEVCITDQSSSPSANFNANVRCDSGTTLNVTLTGYSLER